MANTSTPTSNPSATTTNTVTTSDNAHPLAYDGVLNGTETTAQQIVTHDATTSNTAPVEPVVGQAAPFAGMDIMDPAHMMNNLNVSSGMPMKSPANASTPALNSSVAVDTSVAAVHLVKPEAGHTETVQIQPGEKIATAFDPNSADLHMQGQNLVMNFHDGSQIVLDHFAQDTHNMPSIELPNGTLIAGGIIVAQLEGTEQVFNLQTAAGGVAAGGGQFIYSDDFGSVIGLLNKLPPLGFTGLTFAQPEPRVLPANALIDNVGGTFTTTVTTIITPPGGGPIVPGNPGSPDLGGLIGPVSGGFEDWQPYKNIGDHTADPMALHITFTPSDNEVVDTVTISNIPTGVQFFFGTPGNYVLIPNVNGSVTFTGAQLAANNIYLLPPSHSDQDVPLTITLNIHDPDNNLTAVVSQNTVAVVDAVADQPTLTASVAIGSIVDANHVITAGEHTPIALNVNVTFPDNDGSETHVITLSGVPHDWTLLTNTIPGTTFTATTNSDGTITYTATVVGNVTGTVTFDPHDYSSATGHGNGSANLVLTATTTENVTDGELTTANNTASATIPFTVTITEDVPTIVSTTSPVTISENGLLLPAPDQVSGNITVDFHNDNPGTVKLVTDGLTALNLTSHGSALTYTVSVDGKTITAMDSANHVVFTIGLNAPTTSGTQQSDGYTFTLVQPLDHPPGQGANTLDIPVHFTATDSDGDSAAGAFHVTVVDGVPTVDTSSITTDETNPFGQSIHGTVAVAFGPDGAGSIAASNTFSATGSVLGGALTSHGAAVTVTLANGIYTGTANGATVFTLSVAANGSYTFQQFLPLDHADGHNPNDTIDLNFGVQATDFDGDTATSTITVHVVDDAPIAVNDTNFVPNGATVATGNVLANDTFSHDSPTLVQSATVNGVTKDFGHPDGTDAGGAYINLIGTYGTLHLHQDGSYTYTYDTANHNGNLTEKFDYTIVDYDGDTSSTANQSGLVITIVDNGPGVAPSIEATVDETTLGTPATGTIVTNNLHAYALAAGVADSGSETAGHLTSHGVAVTIALVNGQYIGTANGATVFTMTLHADGSYNFTQTGVLDHADGTNPNDVIDLKFNYTGLDANNEAVPGTITVHVRDDAPTAVADTNAVQNGGSVATGNVIANDILSHDAPNVLQSVSFAGHTVSFANATGTDANGKYIDLAGTYGTIHIYQNGDYTYTYDNAHNTGDHTEQFGYTIVDFDGDTSTTSGQTAGTGLTITIHDGAPTAAPTFIGVDETNTLNQTFTGTFNSTFGPDGAGSVAANNSFNATGSLLGGALFSHGVAIVVTLANGIYTGTANGATVFTMQVNADGTYSFNQHLPLDHADGSNINDAIDLNFGYTVTDHDGDTASSVITVRVLDDAPIAIADTNAIQNGGTIATGNVIANDTLSHDAPNVLQSVSFAGNTVSFANPTGTDANGKYINLVGTYGTIHIYQNGDYTYTYDTMHHTGTNVEQFGYTIVDYDGDTSTTSGQTVGTGLTITIVDNGPGPAPTITTEVQEVTLGHAATGTITVTDATNYGLTTGFSSGGSETGGNLTSHGVPVTVGLVNGQYVGTANGVTVFTLTLNPDGSYNFTQNQTLDHADGSNPHDAITLTFAYIASDGDGDTSLGHIVVNVIDDAPVAVADVNAIPNNGTTAVGNILTNDILSHDTPNNIQSISFNGVTKDFGHPDGVDSIGKYVTLTGAYGTIELHDNGQYTYTYTNVTHTGDHVEQFNYTIVDGDGDTSGTTLTINITDTANLPPVITATGGADHDAMFNTQSWTVDTGALPALYELNNIDCTPAQFALLAERASNMLNLNFPTVLTIDIQHDIQQHDTANGLGAFQLDANGNISNVQLLFGSTGDTPFNSNNEATYDTSGGTGKVVFFIMTDAFAELKAAGLAGVDGNALNPANITLGMEKEADGSLHLTYTDAGGVVHVLNTVVYTSDQSFNSDGQVHAVAGTEANQPAGTAVYAFEDAAGPQNYYGSDRDFNDVVFSVSAQSLVTASYDQSAHQLFSTLNITDADSPMMSEALVEVRNTHAGDSLTFDFTGSAYTMSGNHVYDHGVDTGITATVTTNSSGNLDVHLIGAGTTADYNGILQSLHFGISGDPLAASGDRTIDITVTDDHHMSSTLTTIYNIALTTDSSVMAAPAGGGTVTGTAHDDILVGSGSGNNTLIGGDGNDTLVVSGSGTNTLTGGNGSDTFMFLHGTTGVSHITDYHQYEGDRIDISDLLTGSAYTPGVSHVQDFVKIDASTGSVYVDTTGHGQFTAANHIATIDNVFSVETVNVLLNDHEGNKVVHTV